MNLSSLMTWGMMLSLLGACAHRGPASIGGASVSHCESFDSNDEFPFEARFKAPAHYAGECIDTTQARPIRILSFTDVARVLSGRPALEKTSFAAQPGDVYVANFSHAGKFWIARIPQDGIQNIYYQIEYFPVLPVVGSLPPFDKLASHSELRFQMKMGNEVYLIPQNRKDDSQVLRLRNFVFSSEAVMRRGDTFDLINKGTQGFYAIGYRFTSLDDKIKSMILEQHHQVDQILLNLNDAAKERVLETALHMSDSSNRGGMPEIYNSWDKSCITEAFRTLDQATDYNPGGEDSIFGKVNETRASVNMRFPPFARDGLTMRKLSSDTPVPSLQQEFQQSPAGLRAMYVR
ncbi:MAG: hypothetical protein JST16_15905 [Bdellovibrionales bacterium]|nr:hypothetical protein [Bdellovibrionales bacterium]